MNSTSSYEKIYFNGISLLRMLAMFMVVILHILLQGGVLAAAAPSVHTQFDPVTRNAAWLLEAGAFCAVDTYALISGFVGFSPEARRFHPGKYLEMWLQVVFYSVLLTLVLFLFYHNTMWIMTIPLSFFPVSTGAYWYFTAYTGVFFLAPAMDRLVRALPEEMLKKTGLILFGVMSCYATAASFFYDVFGLQKGYSFLWLAFLYFLGAILRKCGLYEKGKRWLLAAGILLCWFLTWLAQLCGESLTGRISHGDIFFFSYTSPTVVGMAILLLLLFASISVPKGRELPCRKLGAAAFGVYLLHAHPQVWNYLLKDRFAFYAGFSLPMMVGSVLLTALGIFILGAAADIFRKYLFRITGLSAFCEKW